jgi:formate dehydrogenase maturation protein FdhE
VATIDNKNNEVKLEEPRKCPNCSGNIYVMIRTFTNNSFTEQLVCTVCDTKWENTYQYNSSVILRNSKNKD